MEKIQLLPVVIVKFPGMMASEFIQQIKADAAQFLEAVEAELPFVKQYYADHVCWRTETEDEYVNLISTLKSCSVATLLTESIIGGRPIATFKLDDGILCCSGRRNVNIIEIPSPKVGSPYRKGLEHVEYVVGNEGDIIHPINDAYHQAQLQKFMEGHPEITSWNKKAMMKSINPDVSMTLNLPHFGKCSVKFHLVPLENVIEYEISTGWQD